jgi:hypothetical protein
MLEQKKEEIKSNRKLTKLGFILNSMEKKIQKPKIDKCPCLIKLCDGVYSKGNKEITAIAIEDFLIKYPNIYSDGFRDTHSSLMREHLEKEFPMYDWYKNSSQNPFDIYSIDALVAIENKTANVSGLKRINDFATNNRLVTNATIYPDKVKVKDVVPKKLHYKYDEITLDTFMDVIVVVVDKDIKTNTLVRYRIVDGSYWGVDYDTYIGARDFFSAINDLDVKKALFESVSAKHPNNKFVNRVLNNDLESVNLDLRKLFMVDNPTKELI